MGKVRRPKGVLMFDTSARKSYLTGFRKRKQERREKAKVELEEQARKDKIAERKEKREAKHEQLLRAIDLRHAAGEHIPVGLQAFGLTDEGTALSGDEGDGMGNGTNGPEEATFASTDKVTTTVVTSLDMGDKAGTTDTDHNRPRAFLDELAQDLNNLRRKRRGGGGGRGDDDADKPAPKKKRNNVRIGNRSGRKSEVMKRKNRPAARKAERKNIKKRK